MKTNKSIFTQAIICIFTTLIIQNASCQPGTNSTKFSTEAAETGNRKDYFTLPETTLKDYINAINIKAVRKFSRDFRDAKNVNWCKAGDGTYVARFVNDSIRTTVAYNFNGSWGYTLKKYAENKMPDEVRNIVKSAFSKYTIAEVTEIESPQAWEDVIYCVLIKYSDNFKILNIRNGDMEIIRDYTRP